MRACVAGNLFRTLPMKNILLFSIAALLAGCANHPLIVTPISTVAVQQHVVRAQAATAQAQASATKIEASAGRANSAITSAQAAVTELAVAGNRVESLQGLLATALQANEETVAENVKVKEAAAQIQAQLVQTEAEREKAQAASEAQEKQANQDRADKQKSDAIALSKTEEAHENAKERDVVLIAFAVIFALWTFSQSSIWLAQMFPAYAILAQSIFFALSLATGYGIGRVVLLQAAKFIP